MGASFFPEIPSAVPAASAVQNGTEANTDFIKLSSVPTGANLVAGWYTATIDLTTTGIYTVLPATPSRLRIIQSVWEIKTTGGVLSAAPIFSAGTNSASFDNAYASQTGSQLITQAAETGVNPTSVNPGVFVDLTASGFKVNVTTGATGTLPVLTARWLVYGLLVPV